MGKPKKTYTEVKKLFEDNGYILVSQEYIRCSAILQTICPKGHDYPVRYRDFKRGIRCSSCKGLRQKTLEEIKVFFKKEGYQIISSEYVNSTTPLHAKCPEGHSCFPTYGNFQQGARCATCSGHQKIALEDARKIFEKEGYTLISKEYNSKKLQTVCPNGHNYNVRLAKFERGNRCPDCSGLKKKTLEQVKELFESEGYKVISKEYVANNIPVYTICPKGHDYPASYSNFKSGYRCPICQNNGTSEAEIELFKELKKSIPYLTKRNFKVVVKNRPYIKGFQVDILDPKTRLGIEYDGPYYHEFEGLKRSRQHWPDEAIENYHEIKDQALMNCHDIKILHIKGKEWEENKQACIDRCLKFLGVSLG